MGRSPDKCSLEVKMRSTSFENTSLQGNCPSTSSLLPITMSFTLLWDKTLLFHSLWCTIRGVYCDIYYDKIAVWHLSNMWYNWISKCNFDGVHAKTRCVIHNGTAINLISTIDTYDKLVIARGILKKVYFNVHHVFGKEKKFMIFYFFSFC